jgi:hypothetical protein
MLESFGETRPFWPAYLPGLGESAAFFKDRCCRREKERETERDRDIEIESTFLASSDFAVISQKLRPEFRARGKQDEEEEELFAGMC